MRIPKRAIGRRSRRCFPPDRSTWYSRMNGNWRTARSGRFRRNSGTNFPSASAFMTAISRSRSRKPQRTAARSPSGPVTEHRGPRRTTTTKPTGRRSMRTETRSSSGRQTKRMIYIRTKPCCLTVATSPATSTTVHTRITPTPPRLRRAVWRPIWTGRVKDRG